MFRINFQNSRDIHKGVGHLWMGIGMVFLTTITTLSAQVEGRSGEGGASVAVPQQFKNTRDLNLNVNNGKPLGNIKLEGGGGGGDGKKKERIFLGDDSLLSFSYAGAGTGGKLSIGGGIYGGGQLGLGGYNGFGLGVPNPSFYSRPFSFYGGPGPILSGGVFGSLLGSSYGYGHGHGIGFNNNYGHGNSLGFGFSPGFQYKHHKHHFHHGHGFSHFNYNHHQGGLISPFTAIY